jgi:hypothetical protein
VIVPWRYSHVTTRIPRMSVKIDPIEVTLITSQPAISAPNSPPASLAVAALPSPTRRSSPSTSPSVVRGAVRTFSSSA